MNDTNPLAPPHAHPNPAADAYARTLLGKLDHRYLKSAGVRWVLAILVGLVLVVPSVQFVVKIQETEYSAVRQREKHRSAVGRWLPDAQALVDGENPYSEGHWFPNPPLVLMALVPFAYLPIVVTAVLWSILKIAALVGGCWLVVASARGRPSSEVESCVPLLLSSARESTAQEQWHTGGSRRGLGSLLVRGGGFLAAVGVEPF